MNKPIRSCEQYQKQQNDSATKGSLLATVVLIILCVIAALTSSAQDTTTTRPPDAVQTLETLTAHSTLTADIYTDLKGIQYPIYKGAKGGLYIIRISSKTGMPYKYYPSELKSQTTKK